MLSCTRRGPRPFVQRNARCRRSGIVRTAVEPRTSQATTEVRDCSASLDAYCSLEQEPLSSQVAVSTAVIGSPEKEGSSLADTAVVRWYMQNLQTHPLQTKCWTSLSGFVIGDITAQLLTEPTFMLSRTLILAGYGFFIDAPAGNAFYNWLDAKIEPGSPKTAKAVGKKILIDQLIYAPIFTCILYTYLQLAHGDLGSIPEVLQEKVVPTLMANYAVWPLAHALNFYYVPTEQRILYNNAVAVCWTTWLSCLAH